MEFSCSSYTTFPKLSSAIALGQVVSRLRRYGVRISGKWSFDNLFAAFAGVDAVGQKLAQKIGGSAQDAFKETFTSVNFQWVDGACGAQTDRCYADAKSFPNTIKFYSKWWATNTLALATPPVDFTLAIHEIGHAFNSRTIGIFNQDVANRGINDKTGFGLTVGAKGQSEVTADLFTNYVLGTFTGPGLGGVNLPGFMDTNIVTWVNLASTP